jgi:NADP-dependent 3-hydroxy acid dehydrogenase YdfG
MAMSKNIEGKVVVITGASSGLGNATARHLSAQGGIVVLGARRVDLITALADDLAAQGGKALAIATDVTHYDQVQKLVDAAVQTYGRVDVMINNAGAAPISQLERIKVEGWDQMIDVNIKGVLYGIAAALPYMKQQKAGHILNVSSVAAYTITPATAVLFGDQTGCALSLRGTPPGSETLQHQDNGNFTRRDRHRTAERRERA